MSGRITRRAALTGAAAVVPFLASAPAGAAPARPGTDAEVLQSAIGLELAAVFAYRTLARSSALDMATARMLRRFARQELEHADALRTALEALGSPAPPQDPRTVADVDRVLPGLGEARSQTDALTYAIELETAAVAAYHDAIRRLGDPKLLQTAASIMACEGQQLAMLRDALNEKPVPHALETGGR